MTTDPYVPDWTEIRDAYAYQMVHYGGATFEDVRRDAQRGIAKIQKDSYTTGYEDALSDVKSGVFMSGPVHEATQAIKAAAWDEGFNAGWEECRNPGPFVNDVWDSKTPNPYWTQEADDE